jgi:predicted transposase YdaD
VSKPFDATLKRLLEESPSDWPVLAGLPRAPAEVIDADISTVTGAADKVLRVRGAPDWIMHVEFQREPDQSLPRRTHVYNALLEDRHELPIRSIVVLLAPTADLSNLTGEYERGFAGEPPYLRFMYQVIRVWQLPVGTILSGGLGTLPLAPIGAVTRAEVPAVIERMKDRLRGRRGQTLAKDLWTATYILLGMRYDRAFAKHLLRGVMTMEESTTYQAILEEGALRGALQEARKNLLLVGHARFRGTPPAVRKTIEAISDVAHLEDLLVRSQEATSWQELLGLPEPARRSTRRKSKA